MKKEEIKFGMGVEYMGAAMKGLVFYCVLLTTNFWQYQDYKGEFQPWLVVPIIFFPILLAYIYCKWDDIQCVVLHLVAGVIWTLYAMLTVYNYNYNILVIIIAIADSLFQKFVLGDLDARRYARRYKMQNYLKWGAMMSIISIVMLNFSDGATAGRPIGPGVCLRYMIGAFAVYVLLIVLFRYMFLQYNYFRQKDSIGGFAFTQLKRMNWIIAILALVIIGFAVALVHEAVVDLVSKIVVILFGGFVAMGFRGLSEIPVKQLENGKDVSGMLEVPDGLKKVNSFQLFGGEFPVREVGTILLIVLVIHVLLKLYKKFLSRFKGKNDEAEYIVVAKEKTKYYASTEEQKRENGFSNNNRGRIRKIFYKNMNSRIRREDTLVARHKTPGELTEQFARTHEKDKYRKMTRLYEKARYSHEECTDEDVAQMKNLENEI